MYMYNVHVYVHCICMCNCIYQSLVVSCPLLLMSLLLGPVQTFKLCTHMYMYICTCVHDPSLHLHTCVHVHTH